LESEFERQLTEQRVLEEKIDSRRQHAAILTQAGLRLHPPEKLHFEQLAAPKHAVERCSKSLKESYGSWSLLMRLHLKLIHSSNLQNEPRKPRGLRIAWRSWTRTSTNLGHTDRRPLTYQQHNHTLRNIYCTQLVQQLILNS